MLATGDGTMVWTESAGTMQLPGLLCPALTLFLAALPQDNRDSDLLCVDAYDALLRHPCAPL